MAIAVELQNDLFPAVTATPPAEIPEAFREALQPKPLSLLLAEAIDNAAVQEKQRRESLMSKHEATLAREIPTSPDQAAAMAVRSLSEELMHPLTAMQTAAFQLKRVFKDNPDPAIATVIRRLEVSYEKAEIALTDNLEAARRGEITWDTEIGTGQSKFVLGAHHSATTSAKHRHLLASLAFQEAGFNQGTIARVPLGAGR